MLAAFKPVLRRIICPICSDPLMRTAICKSSVCRGIYFQKKHSLCSKIQALDALSQSYKLVEDKAKAHNEYHRAVSEIASRMTREQLADFVITILHDYEAKGIIAKPSRQTVSPQEKREAMFLQIKSWQSSTKKTQTDYENCVASWTLAPMSATMAYVQVRLFLLR